MTPMSDEKLPFSDRHGFRPAEAEITIRSDFPVELRSVVVDISYEAGMGPHSARSVICKVLRKREDQSNWSAPNVDNEARQKLDEAQWYEAYDVLEAMDRWLKENQRTSNQELNPILFEREINKFFRKEGVGWQLHGGEIRIRGTEAWQEVIEKATTDLAGGKLETASSELRQALYDLSRRPAVDLTGAVQHSLAAVECAAREVTSDRKATLGELIKRNPGFFPPPLDQAVEKLWGFASEKGRHLREGREPTSDEAQLVVGLSAALSSFIAAKNRP
jgi:hypothetical protein